jgi:hypothetical protein
MSKIPTVHQSVPPVVSQGRPDVGALMRRFLQPEPLIASALAFRIHEPWVNKFCRGWNTDACELRRELSIRSLSAEARETACKVAALFAEGDEKLGKHRAAILAASEPATRLEAEALLTLTQDAFRVRPDERAEISASATIYLLEGEDRTLPSGYLIASAIDAALRTLRFAPAPSEIFELTTQAKVRLGRARLLVDQISEIAFEARAIAASKPGEALPPPYARGQWPVIWRPRPILVDKPQEGEC